MKNQKTIIGYKFITEDMKSKNGNHIWKLGEWYKEENVELCKHGFHACKTPLQSLEFIYGDKWFIVEAKGKIIQDNKCSEPKFVSSEMRLVKEIPVDKVIKRFAIWCAKQCLKNYEKLNPNDKRPAEAIQAAEDYLDGKIDLQEVNNKLSAAESAARSAAESAARSAAESAAESAWSAAESAARSAAESAAWSAWSAESAARSAAESAARSAWSAESAARSAAESAARSAQNKELLKLIKEFT